MINLNIKDHQKLTENFNYFRPKRPAEFIGRFLLSQHVGPGWSIGVVEQNLNRFGEINSNTQTSDRH